MVTPETSGFFVGGIVSGLSGSGLVLQNNGGDDLAVSEDGDFTFITPLEDLSSYSVTVLSHPTTPSQTCTVANSSGSLAGSDVTDVTVTCISHCNVNMVSGVAEGVYEACEILVLGPDFTVVNGTNVFVNSGWKIDFMPGFLVEHGATLSANVCGQSLCMTSPNPMPYGCHTCVDQICDSYPNCCGIGPPVLPEGFNADCLGRVDTVCGLVCE